MINKEEVKKLAFLARLELSKEEIENAPQEMKSILSYVEKINNVNTSNINPFFHFTETWNTTREDEIISCTKESHDIIKKMGKYEKDYLKIDLVL